MTTQVSTKARLSSDQLAKRPNGSRRIPLGMVSLSIAMMFVLAPKYMRADALPFGDSDLLRWFQPGNPVTAEINPDPADPNPEISISLGPFAVTNANVIVQNAPNVTTSYAVLLNEGSLLNCQGGANPVISGCSDIVVWQQTGLALGMQSITVSLFSDSAVFNIGPATIVANQTEAGPLNGNDLSALFFSAAGRAAGYGLLAQSDVPEPTSVLLLSTVMFGIAGVFRRRLQNRRC
jgi:PEP-CTERM motif